MFHNKAHGRIDKISEALRNAFMKANRRYREPDEQQLSLNFE